MKFATVALKRGGGVGGCEAPGVSGWPSPIAIIILLLVIVIILIFIIAIVIGFLIFIIVRDGAGCAGAASPVVIIIILSIFAVVILINVLLMHVIIIIYVGTFSPRIISHQVCRESISAIIITMIYRHHHICQIMMIKDTLAPGVCGGGNGNLEPLESVYCRLILQLCCPKLTLPPLFAQKKWEQMLASTLSE